MGKRKFLTFFLAGGLIVSFMSSLTVSRVSAITQWPIILPFFTSWEYYPGQAHGRTNSVDYSEAFSSSELGCVLNQVGPPNVFGYDFGSYQLKAAGQFDSSNSYCYFNLFDMTTDSDFLPPIKIRPYTFINIWYYHANLAHCMIDAKIYNKRTQQYSTLRDFVVTYHIDSMIVNKYIVDQNGTRIHPGHRYNDTVGSWQFASFDLSIVYENDPENWYITKIWIGFDNRIDPNHPTGLARTYFDMLYISYGAGKRQTTTYDDAGVYYNAWTTGSIKGWYHTIRQDGKYVLGLKVAISAFNDGYFKDIFHTPIRPYKLRVSTTASEAQFLDHPKPTGLNLTQPDPSGGSIAGFVLDAAIVLVSLKCTPLGWLLTAMQLASEFLGLLKMPDPNVTTYEWPHGVGWFTYGLPYYDLPYFIQSEVCILISGLNPSVQHSIPITFEVEYCYPHPNLEYGLIPRHFETESFTLNINWTTTPDYVNLPPETPSTPSGPASGYTYTTYTYSTSTTDLNGDSVRYQFDWSDGTTSLTGWYASGATASASHYWTSIGTYYVKVRAQDSPGLWSVWSPSLAVSITTSGSPGSCPIFSVFDGSEYILEGLLAIHNLDGADVVTYHPLTTTPQWMKGAYLLRLTEHPKTHSYIDQVKLFAALDNRTILELPLISAVHSEYGNVLPQLLKSDDIRTDTDANQIIDLKFAALNLKAEVVSFVFQIEGYNPYLK